MKRRTFLTFLSTTSILSLAGCNTPQNNTTPSTETQTPNKTQTPTDTNSEFYGIATQADEPVYTIQHGDDDVPEQYRPHIAYIWNATEDDYAYTITVTSTRDNIAQTTEVVTIPADEYVRLDINTVETYGITLERDDGVTHSTGNNQRDFDCNYRYLHIGFFEDTVKEAQASTLMACPSSTPRA